MTTMDNDNRTTPESALTDAEIRKRQRSKNLAVLAALLALVVLIYVVAMVRMSGG